MTELQTVLDQLAALEDPKVRAANEKRGDDHGLNLAKLRKLAKQVGVDQARARALWATGETGPKLLALLVCRPQEFAPDELDAMLREPNAPKVVDWLTNYVLKKSPYAEELRLRWFDDPDPRVAAAAWALTAVRVAKQPDGLDLEHLLDLVDPAMRDAPPPLQWTMNETLAQIGIHHPALRDRAIGIGERLQVLADYPTSKGCTSPYAPLWIAEMVRRQADS